MSSCNTSRPAGAEGQPSVAPPLGRFPSVPGHNPPPTPEAVAWPRCLEWARSAEGPCLAGSLPLAESPAAERSRLAEPWRLAGARSREAVAARGVSAPRVAARARSRGAGRHRARRAAARPRAARGRPCPPARCGPSPKPCRRWWPLPCRLRSAPAACDGFGAAAAAAGSGDGAGRDLADPTIGALRGLRATGGARPRAVRCVRRGGGHVPARVVHLHLAHRDVARAPGAPGHRGAQHGLGRHALRRAAEPGQRAPAAPAPGARADPAAPRTAAFSPAVGTTGSSSAIATRWRRTSVSNSAQPSQRATWRRSVGALERRAAGRRELLADLDARRLARPPPAGQRLARLEDERLHLVAPHAEDLGDLVVAVVAQLEEHERRALLLGQLLEVGQQAAQLGAAVDVGGQAVARRRARRRGPTCSRRARRIDRQRLRAMV